MSHGLRTPPNAVIGVSQILHEEAEDRGRSDFSEPLERVARAGRHLLGLIDETLDLTRIEAGKIELHLRDVDIASMTVETLETMTTAVEKNNNRSLVACDDSRPRRPPRRPASTAAPGSVWPSAAVSAG